MKEENNYLSIVLPSKEYCIPRSTIMYFEIETNEYSSSFFLHIHILEKATLSIKLHNGYFFSRKAKNIFQDYQELDNIKKSLVKPIGNIGNELLYWHKNNSEDIRAYIVNEEEMRILIARQEKIQKQIEIEEMIKTMQIDN